MMWHYATKQREQESAVPPTLFLIQRPHRPTITRLAVHENNQQWRGQGQNRVPPLYY